LKNADREVDLLFTDDTDGFGLKMLFLAEMPAARQQNVSLLMEMREANAGLLHRKLARVPGTT
jgi:hypothetical protein